MQECAYEIVFEIYHPNLVSDEDIRLLGNSIELGNWNGENAIKLYQSEKEKTK